MRTRMAGDVFTILFTMEKRRISSTFIIFTFSKIRNGYRGNTTGAQARVFENGKSGKWRNA